MLPMILSDNRFLDNTPTATDTATDFDVNNIGDLRTWTQWKAASAGTKYLTVQSALTNTGSQLLTNGGSDVWTQGATPFDTLTVNANHIDIDSIVYSTSGTQTCHTNSIPLTSGKLYRMVATETHTSGAHINLSGTNGFPTVTLDAGANNIYFIATDSSTIITITATEASNNACTFVLYEVIDGEADSLYIRYHNFFTASATISIESSNDNSSWTERLAGFTVTDNRAIFKMFTKVQAAYWRVKIVTASIAPYCAIVLLGERMEFPKGLCIGDGAIKPHGDIGIVADSVTGETGNLLGTSLKYNPITMEAEFAPGSLWTWWNETFWPWWRDYACRGKPFVWATDASGFPGQIYWMMLDLEEDTYSPPMTLTAKVDRYVMKMKGVLEL